jgi:hypothetical protein
MSVAITHPYTATTPLLLPHQLLPTQAAVASSSSIIGALRKSILAIAMRCFWPPLANAQLRGAGSTLCSNFAWQRLDELQRVCLTSSRNYIG